MDLSGLKSQKTSLICFSLPVSLYKLSSVFVDVTFSHLLNTEMKYWLNCYTFFVNGRLLTILFYCCWYQGSLLDALQIILNLTLFNLLSSKTNFSKSRKPLLLDCLICLSKLFILINLLREYFFSVFNRLIKFDVWLETHGARLAWCLVIVGQFFPNSSHYHLYNWSNSSSTLL